jgi:hypothetical protein
MGGHFPKQFHPHPSRRTESLRKRIASVVARRPINTDRFMNSAPADIISEAFATRVNYHLPLEQQQLQQIKNLLCIHLKNQAPQLEQKEAREAVIETCMIVLTDAVMAEEAIMDCFRMILREVLEIYQEEESRRLRSLRDRAEGEPEGLNALLSKAVP